MRQGQICTSDFFKKNNEIDGAGGTDAAPQRPKRLKNHHSGDTIEILNYYY
jgi:hypothetical protein